MACIRWLITLIMIATMSAYADAQSYPPAHDYISLLLQCAAHCRSQVPAMTASAEAAAARFVAGGKLWVGGSQPEFGDEAYGRAGGLTATNLLKVVSVGPNDIVLYGVRGELQPDDHAVIKLLRSKGTYVVLFCGRVGEDDLADVCFMTSPESVIGLVLSDSPSRFICPTDTVANIVNLWAWTGEFIAACTRLGKMPVMYKSFGLEGGRQWAAKYRGHVFHDDMKIEPIAGGILAGQYIDRIEAGLKQMCGELGRIHQAAQWCAASPDGLLVLSDGHMFPRHFQDPRAPQPGGFTIYTQSTTLAKLPSPHDCIVCVGYQQPPQQLIDQVADTSVHLIYLSVVEGKQPQTSANILYLNPNWPMADACVNVPGYGVPILPASGVLDAACYWAMVADQHAAAAKRDMKHVGR